MQYWLGRTHTFMWQYISEMVGMRNSIRANAFTAGCQQDNAVHMIAPMPIIVLNVFLQPEIPPQHDVQCKINQ